MKKFLIVLTTSAVLLVFSNCHSSKKAMAAIPKSTFETDMKTLIVDNCSPCHIPAKNGNKKPYDNYANVKEDINDIVRRIELHPGERGFMPQRRARLNDSTIAAFKKWQADGMLEK